MSLAHLSVLLSKLNKAGESLTSVSNTVKLLSFNYNLSFSAMGARSSVAS